MLQFRFGIGSKLAVSAAVGIMLVAGLVINELRVNDTIERLSAQSRRTADLVADTLTANLSFGEIKAAEQALQGARSPVDVDKLVDRVRGAAINGGDSLDAARGAAAGSGGEDLASAKSLLDRYVNATIGLAAAQRDFLATEAAQSVEVAAWDKALETIFKNPFLIPLGNRRDVERHLNLASSDSKSAQIASWRFRATGDNALRASVGKILDHMEQELATTHDILSEPALIADLDKLIAEGPRFRTAMMAALKAADQVQQVARNETAPLPPQIDELIAKAQQAAMARREAINARTAAEILRGGLISLVLGAIVIAVLIAAAGFAVIVVARPLRRVGEALVELANGNKTVEIPCADRRDEIGDNARAAVIFKDSLLRIERMEAEQRKTEAELAAKRKAEMRRLAGNFETATGHIVDAISSASSELEAAAGTLTRTAESTQRLASVVTDASAEASGNVQRVTSAAEGLTGSVSEISQQVNESSRIANEAVRQAQRTDARINELAKAATRIGDVVKLITAIAEQTNLLALNATIEAARAGEAGRGFAIVAQEVKALAAQTAKATEEIGSQIAGMQAATGDSVNAIKEIGATIARISDIAAAIAAAVEEQGMTIRDIARNVGTAAQSTAQVARSIGDVNNGASETGSASSQVLAAARALSNQGSRLKIEVGTFLETVRTA